MDFDKRKVDVLSKKDKSKAGGIDEPIKELVDLINSKKNFYTTSSCAGRIVLLHTLDNLKQNCEWLFCEHREVSEDEVVQKLEDVPDGKLWFRMESFILHVCSRDLESAELLLNLCKELGLKRAGIISLQPRIMLELIGSESLVSIIARDGELVSSNKHIFAMVEEGNYKLKRNFKKISKLKEKIEMI